MLISPKLSFSAGFTQILMLWCHPIFPQYKKMPSEIALKSEEQFYGQTISIED